MFSLLKVLFTSLQVIYYLTNKNVNGYDIDQANIGEYLSGAAYCGKDKYKTMQLDGVASGFVYQDTLYDIKTDLQGYIGYLSSKKTIYVALRGSSSVLNWLDDAEVKLVDYTNWSTCGCKVHYGFYRSALGITNKTIDTIILFLIIIIKKEISHIFSSNDRSFIWSINS